MLQEDGCLVFGYYRLNEKSVVDFVA